MRKRFCLVLLCLLMASFAKAQTLAAKTTICQIAAHPRSFDGRIVSVRAKVLSGFEVFAIQDPSGKCDRMWLQYAGGTPTAMMSMASQTPKPNEPRISLVRNAEFEKFEMLLKAQMYSRSQNVVSIGGLPRYEVAATMTGRVDVAPKRSGYGHLNAYALQFELQSVSDVAGEDLSGTYDPAQFSITPVRFPTGYFRGIVWSPSGEPVRGIEVTATRTDGPLYMRQVWKRTDEEGRFQLDVIPGTYVVGISSIRFRFLWLML